MVDPLLIIFAPYAVVMTGVIASPLLMARALGWRRGAARLNARSCCGRCEGAFAFDTAFHLYLGCYICEPCAVILGRRWPVGLAVTTLGVGVMAVGAGAGFVSDIVRGGPALEWWRGPRLVAPLLLARSHRLGG
jgi:hypothetical protein